MLVLTGQGSSERLHKESHQVMDVVAMFEPVTKWAAYRAAPDTIPEIVRKAVRLARTEKPGAVHIELPEDIAKLDASTQPIQPRRFRRAVPDDKIVDRAFELLRRRAQAGDPRGQRLHPPARQQAAARALREDRHRRAQHLHGEGRRGHGRGLLPVHRSGSAAKRSHEPG